MNRRSFLFSAAATALAAAQPPVRVLILTGESHYHEPRLTSAAVRDILEFYPGTEVRISDELRGATASTFESYDVLLMNLAPREPEKARWGIDSERAFFDAVRKGKGVAVYHYALDFRPEMNDDYERLCGAPGGPATAGILLVMILRFGSSRRIILSCAAVRRNFFTGATSYTRISSGTRKPPRSRSWPPHGTITLCTEGNRASP